MAAAGTPHPLTDISRFAAWCAKREDGACLSSDDYPSGSKVRQYMSMAHAHQGAPMIVGCSAHSAMQIYVAAAAAQTGVPGIVYTAARKQRTEATGYALRMGAEVVEVRPAYLSVCRSRAKARAGTLERYVQWNPLLAIKDAADQCRNIPQDTRRIIVPTGSGLTAAGVLAGIAQYTTPGSMPRVVAIAVSDLADASDIINKAAKATPMPLPVLELIRAPGKYEAWVAAILPDGTPLDPYYAAKALAYMQPGDCLWVPGRRPLSAMPVKCQDSIKRLQDEHAT